MKKSLLTVLAIAAFGVTNAQLSNLGLNTWASGNPSGWQTLNALAAGSTTEITSGAPEGTSAAAVNVVACALCPAFSLPDPMTGVLLQTDDYVAMPTTLTFKWKGNVATGDTALIGAQLTLATSVIADALTDVNPGTSSSSWATQTLTFTYYVASTAPDTAIVVAAADKWVVTGIYTGTSSATTHIDVDDFALTGGNVGYDMIETNNDLIMAFPNPASTFVNLNLLGTDANMFEVYDVTGSLVYAESNIALKTKLDVTNFNNGSYFVKFLNDKKEYIGTARFIVKK
ncbi:MAG TPA: T9SS type A sorting domain-containing protein [Flavobacteriales bacterium]|nr:T9SS type A sorting domain-containing protein [Flavobacteriales bacterium]